LYKNILISRLASGYSKASLQQLLKKGCKLKMDLPDVEKIRFKIKKITKQ